MPSVLDLDDEIGVGRPGLQQVRQRRPGGCGVVERAGEADRRQRLAGVGVHQRVGGQAGVRLLREAADVDQVGLVGERCGDIGQSDVVELLDQHRQRDALAGWRVIDDEKVEQGGLLLIALNHDAE